MEITFFAGAKIPAPIDNSDGLDWNDLCDLMQGESELPRQRADKLHHNAMIFGRCLGSRNKQNIQFLSGLAADFDIGPADPRYRSFHDLCQYLDGLGYRYIAYSTTKSTEDHNKFRVLMPYARDIPVEYCQAAWHKCNADFFNGAIDPSTKDEARLSFLPAKWEGDIFLENGNLIYNEKPHAAFRCRKHGAPVLSDKDVSALTISANKGKKTKPWAAGTIVLPILSTIQTEKLAQFHKPDAPCWALLADLNHSPLVTPWMRDELPQHEGNRDYRFMSYCASNAIQKNLPVNLDTLLVLAERFSTQKLNRPLPDDAMRQAQNALAWAYHNSPPFRG